MKNPDETIDRVLSGLREAEPPEGMEHRIVDAIKCRTSGQREWRLMKPFMPISPRTITTITAACIAIVSLAIGWTAFTVHRAQPALSASTHILPAGMPAPEVHGTTMVTVLPLRRNTSIHLKKNRAARRPDAVYVGDSIALREMRAASHPAPPLPLTAQEKLLVRFVQIRTPEELAMLNPMKWPAQDAEKQTAFDKFFGQQTNGR